MKQTKTTGKYLSEEKVCWICVWTKVKRTNIVHPNRYNNRTYTHNKFNLCIVFDLASPPPHTHTDTHTSNQPETLFRPCHSFPADDQFLAPFPVLSHGNRLAVIQSDSNNSTGKILTQRIYTHRTQDCCTLCFSWNYYCQEINSL